MGIDVWILRENVAADGVALARLGAQVPAKTRAIVAAVEGRSTVAAARSMVVPSTPLSSSLAAPPSALPSSAPAAERPRPASVAAVKQQVAAPATMAPVQVAAAPEFLLCLLDFSRDEGDISCLFLLPYAATALPATFDRFAADLAIACLGGRSEPKRTDLRWPMVKSANFSQSADEARQVVISKLKGCGRDVLVFGSAALAYCGIAANSAPADKGVVEAIAAHDRQFWPLAEVDEYFNAVPAKMALWLTLGAIKAHRSKNG